MAHVVLTPDKHKQRDIFARKNVFAGHQRLIVLLADPTHSQLHAAVGQIVNQRSKNAQVDPKKIFEPSLLKLDVNRDDFNQTDEKESRVECDHCVKHSL